MIENSDSESYSLSPDILPWICCCLCSAKVHAGFTDANLKNTEQSTWLDVSINADFI